MSLGENPNLDLNLDHHKAAALLAKGLILRQVGNRQVKCHTPLNAQGEPSNV